MARYDYHLSPDKPIDLGGVLPYTKVDSHPWLDIHGELELGAVVQGKVRRYWGDVVRTLAPGDVWFCGMFEPHGYQVLETPTQVVSLAIVPDLIAQMVLPEAPHMNWLRPFVMPVEDRPQCDDRTRKEVIELGRRLLACKQEEATPAVHIRIRLLTMQLLLLFAGSGADADTLSHSSSGEQRRQIAVAVSLAFKEHRFVSSNEAARACNLSRDRFLSIFEKELGVSFSKFALRCRVRGAAQDLIATDRPAKTIADSWGFTDESHLHRVFQTHFGCSPREYRLRTKGRKTVPSHLLGPK